MGMGVHKAGINIQPFGIDHFRIFRNILYSSYVQDLPLIK